MQPDITLAEKYLRKVEDAKNRGIEFNLSLTSYKNIQRAKRCYFTGITLTDVPNLANTRTIDRIDPTKGYEKGNVVACSFAANYFKSKIEVDTGLNVNQMSKVIAKCDTFKVIGIKKNRDVDNFENTEKLEKVLSVSKITTKEEKTVINTDNKTKLGPLIKFPGLRKQDLTNKVKGKFFVLGYLGDGQWSMKCKCGEEVKVKSSKVKNTAPICCPKCGY